MKRKIGGVSKRKEAFELNLTAESKEIDEKGVGVRMRLEANSSKYCDKKMYESQNRAERSL